MRIRNSVAVVLAAVVLGLPPQVGAQESAAVLSSLDSLLNLKVSSAAKYTQTVTEAASSVTIVTAEDIERYGYRTVADVLNTLSGFYVTDDHVHPHLGARGFSRPTDFNNRILLLIDGNVANDGVTGSAPLGHDLGLPIRSLERIEVVRGPGSALYGTGAVFAVVNLVTKSAAAWDGAEVGVQTGSYGQRGGSLLFGRRLRSGTDITFAGQWAGADGRDIYFPEFDTPASNGGVAHNLDWERRWGVAGAVRRGDFTLHARYATRTKANPTAPHITDFNAPLQDRNRHGFLQLEYDQNLSPTQHLGVRTYVNRYTLDVAAVSGGAPMVVRARSALVGAETEFRWDLMSANRLTVGTELRRVAQSHLYTHVLGTTVIDSDMPATIVSAYAQDEHQLTRTVSVLGGLRYDHYTTFGQALTPRAAAIYAPTNATTFKLLYGTAFRAPNLIEANLERILYGTGVEVEPEQITTLELLWHQRLGSNLFGTMSLYRYHATDLVTPVVNDEIGSPDRFRNLGHIDATGAEVGWEARFRHGVTAYGNFTYQWATDETADQPLSDSPVQLVKAGLSLHPLPWFRPAVEARYESARRTLHGTATDPYFLTNLHLTLGRHLDAGTRPHVLDRLELSVRVHNLFGVSYTAPGSAEHRQPTLAQEGRSLSAELRYQF